MPRGVPKADKPRLDPLLAALIEKLPEPGSDWPLSNRVAWLGLMERAFGLVYGGPVQPGGAATRRVAWDDGPLTTDVSGGAGQGPTLPRHAPPPPGPIDQQGEIPVPAPTPHFHIDADGLVMRDGVSIDPKELPADVTLWDERTNADFGKAGDTLVWKTDGAVGHPLPAGVVLHKAEKPYHQQNRVMS